MINILFGAVLAAVIIAPIAIRKINRLEAELHRVEQHRDAQRHEAIRGARHYKVCHQHEGYGVIADDVSISQCVPTRAAFIPYGDDPQFAALLAEETCEQLNNLLTWTKRRKIDCV